MTSSFPCGVAEAGMEAIEKCLESILSKKPNRSEPVETDANEARIASVIGFVGETKWSMTYTLPESVATPLMKKLFGMEIPFDSADMADAVGEFANVIAGEVVLQLEKRKLLGRMSLPTVTRGTGVEVVSNRAAEKFAISYQLPMGQLSVQFTAAGMSMFLPKPN